MAELVGMFVVGSVFGGLIVAAWTSDGSPSTRVDYPDDDELADVESRARRVQ